MWRHKPHALPLTLAQLPLISVSLAPSLILNLILSLSAFSSASPFLSLPAIQSEMFMSQAGNHDQSHPVPCLRHLMYFSLISCLDATVKLANPEHLRQPDQTTSFLSPSLVQASLPVCGAALCSARSSALSAGDRLFGIYPLLLCLSSSAAFHGCKKQSFLPLILFLSLPPTPPPLAQLMSSCTRAHPSIPTLIPSS